MNPRILKEIRIVLPAFGLTLSAAVAPLLLVPKEPEGLMFGLFAFGCVFMGALAFGVEFQQGTLDQLLVQPLRRSVIWREKMAVLGVGLVLSTVALSSALLVFRRQVFSSPEPFWIGLLIPLCAFCTTPLLTLLTRSFVGGVVASFLVPLVLLAVNLFIGDETSAILWLLGYCGLSWWLGHRRFTSLQVVDASSMIFSREMGMPARVESALLRPFRVLSARLSGTFGALLKKELRLQLSSFVAAGLFSAAVVIEFFVLIWSHRAPDPGDHWVVAALGITVYSYVCILPAIVGAVSLAEEKSWGVADWQLTLPASVRKQWATKMLVTLSTSLLLGLLLPCALIWGLFQLDSWLSLQVLSHGDEFSLPPTYVMVWCVLGQLLLTSVAIYAASLAGSTARSILLAFGMFLVAGVLIKLGTGIAVHVREFGEQIVYDVLGGRLATGLEVLSVITTGAVLLICLVQRFAFACYRDRHPSWRQLSFQALVLGLSVLLFTVLFHILVRFRGGYVA